MQEELKERKKAKQKRAKERKIIDDLKKQEEIEKQKFLQLSDREKVIIHNLCLCINTPIKLKIYYFYVIKVQKIFS